MRSKAEALDYETASTYVLSINGAASHMSLSLSGAIDVTIAVTNIVDEDADGLIDIYTLDDLNNIRYNLAGTRYQTASDDPGSVLGCPPDGCMGYELTRDLDFRDDAHYASRNNQCRMASLKRRRGHLNEYGMESNWTVP